MQEGYAARARAAASSRTLVRRLRRQRRAGLGLTRAHALDWHIKGVKAALLEHWKPQWTVFLANSSAHQLTVHVYSLDLFLHGCIYTLSSKV